jgi:glycosyltransferase involved in cell wall biosynthesis
MNVSDRSKNAVLAKSENYTHADCVLIIYGVAREDPPASHTIEFLTERGFRVSVIQFAAQTNISTPRTSGFIQEVHSPERIRKLRIVYNLIRWWRFKKAVRKYIAERKPQVVIVIMLHALAAVPLRLRDIRYKLVSCIYDIPSIKDAGKLDRQIIRRGWKRLRRAEIVWASDVHKAHLAREIGQLSYTPVICHNCSPVSYLPDSVWPRDNWLRNELRRAGAKIGIFGGTVLLRAGAIGEYGGIEETLEGMKGLPEDYIFLMMGRPTAEYKKNILSYISALDLRGRAFLWDRPSDDVWKNALRGADIGHLIHGPFPPGRMTRLYNLNSSLSNNRLFQYMAAGLPIIAYDDPRMDNIYKEVPCFQVARLSNLVKDIQGAWRELGSDDGRRKSLGEAGRKAHLRKYCWEVQFSPIFDAIRA